MRHLLQLLDPSIPKNTLDGYLKNNAKWKEGNLLYHFNKILFSLFIAALNIKNTQPNVLNNILTDKYNFRYLDFILKETVSDMKDLQKENENLEAGHGYMLKKDYWAKQKEWDKQESILKDHIETLEATINQKNSFLEEKLAYVTRDYESRIKLYKDQLEKSLLG